MAVINLEQFGNQFKKMVEEIVKKIPDLTKERALTATALVKRRIREEGKNADEIAFPDYSPGYKKKKEKAGKYTGVTNLTLTGKMLNNLQIVNTGRDGKGYFVEIYAKGADEKAKLSYNEDHYHNILGVTKREEGQLAEDFDLDLQEIINKNGFGK